MFPTLYSIGPLTLHTYGLFVAIAFLVGVYFSRQEFERYGLESSALDQIVFILMIGGLFGARLFHFLLENPQGFLEDPLSFFRVWEGGLVFYGSYVVGIFVLILISRIKEIPLLVLGDAFSGPLLLSQAIGRLGCFTAGCCYGKPTDSFLGVTFTHPETLALPNVAVHPTQLYSSLGNGLLFLGIWVFRRYSPPRGTLFSAYLIGYGLFRFSMEFLRNDFRGATLAGLFPSQWISLGLFVTGLILLGYVRLSQKDA